MVCKVASAVPKPGEMRSLSQLEAKLVDGFPHWDFLVATRLGKQVNTGKHTTNHGTSPCFMDRSIISIAIFNSYVGLPERNWGTGTDSKNDLPSVSQIW